MESEEKIYVLSGTLEAINLYLDSLETLKSHNTHQFMVYSFVKKSVNLEVEREMKKEDMQTWETSVLINEKTYHDLYNNLCKKLRDWYNMR